MIEPHAAMRARERYGVELTFEDLDRIEGQCRRREGLLVRDVVHAEHWLIAVRGCPMVFVFVRQEGRVVTVLERDHFCRHRLKDPGKTARQKQRSREARQWARECREAWA